MNTPVYPNITVQFLGQDRNAFNLMGIVSRALADGLVSKEERNEFMEEAMSGDYNNLLRVCASWVNVE